MDAIYEIFEASDGLVLGTPVFYNSVSSQMKLMIDRSYCLARAVSLGPGNLGTALEFSGSGRDLCDLAWLTGLDMLPGGDFEVAVEEGATLVRVGRAIFGARS